MDETTLRRWLLTGILLTSLLIVGEAASARMCTFGFDLCL